MDQHGSPLSDPNVFLSVVVRPNIADWDKSYSDLRLALNAIHSVDAFAAHIFWWAKSRKASSLQGVEHDTAFRQALAESNSEFRYLRDVAKAIKHVNLTKYNPVVAKANQLSVSSIGYGEGGYGEGRFGGPPQVVIKSEGDKIDFMETIVENCLEFLEAELSKLTKELER